MLRKIEITQLRRLQCTIFESRAASTNQLQAFFIYIRVEPSTTGFSRLLKPLSVVFKQCVTDHEKEYRLPATDISNIYI